MAKKNSTEPTQKFDFLKFDKALSKIDGFESGSVIASNTFSEIDEWINTGSFMLNAQISGSLLGGVPNSRAVGLVGDPETGKTFMCLNIAREAQKAGYDIIYCETEAAVDRASVAKMGVDINRLRYQPIRTINDFKHFVVTVIDMIKKARESGENPKIMIFLDSLGMLNTTKEINDALEGKEASDMGLKAKQLRALFRVITLDLAANKIPLIVTNHTTIGNIGSYTGPTKESSGGDGPIFSLSTALILTKHFEIDKTETNAAGDKRKNGIIINSVPKKSRSTIPQKIKIHVGFVGGMNPYVGLEDYATWDACGVGKGKIFTEKEFDKEYKNGSPAARPFEIERDGKTEKLVYVPSETGRWCIKHYGKSVPKTADLWNDRVFTMDVLKQLDENVIKKQFKLPDFVNRENEMENFVLEDDENTEE